MKESNLHIEYSNRELKESTLIQAAVIRSLIYFDIFNYPLTIQEIVRFSSVQFHHLSDVEQALTELTESLMIYKFGDLYSLKNDITLIERRKRGNLNAMNISPKLQKRSNFIYRFPFVRSVNVSGSLSKNYFDETTDFDFFVITSPNRLWITRMLLTIYKKLFLFNNRKYWCINYYVAIEDLLIPDRNLFSATEVITLKNQAGASAYQEFMKANSWVQDYFPNFNPDYAHMESPRKHLFKKRIEKLLSGKTGDSLDNLCWRITLRFLKKRYAWLKEDEFNVNLRTKKHASKHHPQGFQFKVLKAFDEKCREFEKNHEFILR